MDLQDVVERAPAIASIVAATGIVLLLPLYLSQRRDVRRMRAWMAREPDHPRDDLAASEVILDRAETELEKLLGEEPAAAPQATEAAPAPASSTTPAAGATPTTPLPAAARVTHERPALERITMERAALAPHRRWRLFVARATQPRVLVVVGIAAILVAVGGIFLSEVILDEQPEQPERAARIDRSEVTVAVLNGTTASGLAGDVGSDVEASGYRLGAVTNASERVGKTLVLYADGEKPAAQKVARDLGVDPAGVEQIDRESRLLAGGEADVVVIAGEDRTTP